MKDAEDFAADGIPAIRGAEWVHHRLRSDSVQYLSKGVAPQAAITVYINYGRWIAECPDCHGAQLACRTDKRFLCNDCANIAIGNLWRPVIWPADSDVIEDVLTRRPVENQNWDPWQTVEDLQIETAVHEGM